MQLQQIAPWITYKKMELTIKSNTVKSWLSENGPITRRIIKNHDFSMAVLKDEFSSTNMEEKNFLGFFEDVSIKVREVILYADRSPIVFARSLIPDITIRDGLKRLGNIGEKPLGDILFEKELFQRTDMVFGKFQNEKKVFWGRKARYTVNQKPLSVMEVFLVNE